MKKKQIQKKFYEREKNVCSIQDKNKINNQSHLIMQIVYVLRFGCVNIYMCGCVGVEVCVKCGFVCHYQNIFALCLVVSAVRVRIVADNVSLCMCVGGRKRVVLVSQICEIVYLYQVFDVFLLCM